MSLLMVILTLIGGLTLSAQSSINGTLSKKQVRLKQLFNLCNRCHDFNDCRGLLWTRKHSLCFDVPKWQLTCALFGASYLFLTVLAVPKIGVTAANISTVIGQLFASMIIDHFGWFEAKKYPLIYPAGLV